MEMIYEPLYICAETEEGPRSGIAGYRGQPHFFQSDYLDFHDPDNPGPLVCALVPLDLRTFRRLRQNLALAQDPRCIYAHVRDLDQVTVTPEMLPTEQDAGRFQKQPPEKPLNEVPGSCHNRMIMRQAAK